MADFLTNYWAEHYVRRGHCSLCGNIGVIDTRATAVTPAGFRCGDVHFCICPNGQGYRTSSNMSPEQVLRHQYQISGR